MVAVISPSPRAVSSRRQVVFSFDEVTKTSQSAAVRGGKGYHLMEMAALGLPVPSGFTVSTTVARAYQETGALPKRFQSQFDRKLTELEQRTGKRFGDPINPLLVSVRSGAASSMPGMLDTVLNIGLNESIVQSLSQAMGERFARDTWARFQAQFAQLVSGEAVIPSDPHAQLMMAVNAVIESWTSERAQAYRAAHELPEWQGTAVNVQEMVFGNLDDQSGTGVVFSHDVSTGQPGLYGEFLPCAQGEDVVAGVRTPRPIEEMTAWAPGVYAQLVSYVKMLSEYFEDVVDVEFTVEQGEVYLLQVRSAKRTPRAAVTFAVHEAWAGRISQEKATTLVPASTLEQLTRASFDSQVIVRERPRVLARGLAASPGAVVGQVVFSSSRASALAREGKRVILVTRDTIPEDLPGMLDSVGLVTRTGGATCHAAVVAREMNLPSVVGATSLALDELWEGQMLSVDGTNGVVYEGELPLITQKLTKEENIFLRWRNRLMYQPEINFEAIDGQRMLATALLNDFYLSDQVAKEAVGTKHAAKADELRSEVHRRVAGIFAAYLVIAVGGEVRHGFDFSRGNDRIKPALDRLSNGFVPDRYSSQMHAVETLRNADLSRQAEFFELAETVFEYGSWGVVGHGGYGGSKWAEIARTAKLYLAGKMTHTVFVDHVFDLRHNSGVLFNKHRMLSDTRESFLHRQLDIKKEATGLRELYRGLTYLEPQISVPVREMLEAVSPGITTRV